MNLLFPASHKTGFQPIITPDTSQVRLISLGILSLSAGERWQSEFPGVETALIILGGTCHVRANSQYWSEIGQRDSVFAGRATAIYLPPNGTLHIEALTPFEAAIVTAPASNSGDAVLIQPYDVAVRTVGRSNWQRSVQDIIDARVPAERLIIGETFNEPGCWSSYPPHKHDEEIPDVEVCLEEVYHFRVNPTQGFGIQRIYSPIAGLDDVYAIKNGDTVVIPRGYHPVAAAPGYAVYYLWAMAGDNRRMKPHDDPDHAWIHELQ